MASQVLEANLQSAGVRAIVTWRAKNPIRLEAKVRQRAITNAYQSVDEIYDDIVDLAGIRVALYFPAEREEVGRIIKGLFVLVSDQKEFPAGSKPSHKKRFSGYWATHYRVRLPENLLNESQERYAEALLEIQVASVLMHAWSEVEHDLVYKPLQGSLSEDEYAILDELNGLVLAGEIALERLQRAGEFRVSSHDRKYSNHYDLASSLLEMSRAKLAGLDIYDSAIGRVDMLFQLLRDLGLNRPEDLARYVEALHADFEKRPLAEQVIDQILSEDPTRYAVYENIRSLSFPIPAAAPVDMSRTSKAEAIGQFMTLWVEYERMLRAIEESKGYKNPGRPSGRFVASIIDISPELSELHEQLRHFRNQLVHGIKVPDADYIRTQIENLRNLIESMRSTFDLVEKPPSYVSYDPAGVISFDYSNNNGRFLVGKDDFAFETVWSTASNSSIHAYNDGTNIRTIALANGATRFEDIVDARIYDTSSRTRTARVGEIVIWQNNSGHYLATRIERVAARSHGAERDELVFSYKIAPDNSHSFL
jgi:ppGpp synthetase/RelA/SpoT-type nucleotidyltranferase